MDEKIDVLMATYNGERYIREQLDSILSQTYKNINLIISDDCSTDNTTNIIYEYMKKDNRIKLFRQKQNIGYRKNFEFLCKNSTSKYIMFSDQDDVWNFEKIYKMYKYIKEKQCNLVYCDLEIVDKNLNCINKSMMKFLHVENNIKYCDYRAVNLNNVVTGCAMLVKREVIDNCYPFPKDIYPHDWWIALIACQNGEICFYNENLVKYRQHSENTIGIYKENRNDFKNYRNSIIEFQYNHFEICLKNIDKFNSDYQKRVEISYNYFKKLLNNDIINKKYSVFNYVYYGNSFSYKIKKYILLHLPKFAKILFNVRKGVIK